MRRAGTWALAALGGMAASVARAQDAAPPVRGEPHPWQLWHQAPATPVMEMMDGFHHLLLWIMVAIVVLVIALLAFVIVRFNARRNPTPSRTSHNTLIEVVWTVVPVIILVVIAVPSFRLLYFSDRSPDAEMTIKVTGRQWYWDYEYPDQGGFTFSSIMIPPEDIKPGQRRLLEVDNHVVVPVDTNIRVLVTGGDVIHSWAVPAMGVKHDAIPGRINETWMRVERPGIYYGQCSQVCGVNHGYMPVEVEAVPKDRFAQWAAAKKQAMLDGRTAAHTEVAEHAEGRQTIE
ncbi:cytochrome c oxidase subunit II [Azospirillum sp.]|uniref:cytochrome c oxidase subunit II n=1 Tax=Azospirillum sp. TaxID=34012 RepID=UPI003D7174F2